MVQRTVDNLGLDPHLDYARREGMAELGTYEESRKISSTAQYDNYIPIAFDQFDILFNTKNRNNPWGGISKPPGFDLQQQRIYTYQVAPSLGSEELQELQIKRIDDQVAKYQASLPVAAPPVPASNSPSDLTQLQQQGYPSVGISAEANLIIGDLLSTQKEAEVLKKLIEMMLDLDKVLNEVNQKRKQYQKG